MNYGTLLVILLTANLGATELDRYGGWMDVKGEATGSFHIETIQGRDILITPDGHGFVALGINHINALESPGTNEADLFKSRYGGDWKRAAQDIKRQFKDWGFNSVGKGVGLLERELPYLAASSLVRTAKYYTEPGGKNPYKFPDVFDPAVKARLEGDVETFCKQHRDNPMLIAYYWTDTPTWDIHKTRVFRGTDWVSEIRTLPGQAPGKQRYLRFLRERYVDNIQRFNRAYALQMKSFDELADADLDQLDLKRYDIEQDDQVFLGLIATTYYGIVGTATRKHDPKHMVFGEKYLLGDQPVQVTSAAAPYLDALAVQPGDGYIPIYTPGDIYPAREIEALHRLVLKPIFICDHQISFATERYPKAIWPYHQRDNEADAAAATEQFLKEAFAQPYILGYMRCQYIDRFTERRNAIKLGLLRDDGSPYDKLVDASTRANATVKEMVRKAVRKAR